MARNLMAKLSLENEINNSVVIAPTDGVDLMDTQAKVAEISSEIDDTSSAVDEAEEVANDVGEAIAQADETIENSNASTQEIAAAAGMAAEALKQTYARLGIDKPIQVTVESLASDPKMALKISREELRLALESIIESIVSGIKKIIRKVGDGISNFINLFKNLGKQVAAMYDAVEKSAIDKFEFDDYAKERIARNLYMSEGTDSIKGAFNKAKNTYNTTFKSLDSLSSFVKKYALKAAQDAENQDADSIQMEAFKELKNSIYKPLYSNGISYSYLPSSVASELKKIGNPIGKSCVLLNPANGTYLVETENGVVKVKVGKDKAGIKSFADKITSISKKELLNMLNESKTLIDSAFTYSTAVDKKFDWEKVEDFITKVMATTNVDAAYTLTGTYIAVSQTPDNVEYWKAMGRFVGIISDVLYGAPVILEKAVGGALIIAREAVKSKPAEINK